MSSGDRLTGPVAGTAAGVPYIALPSTAVDRAAGERQTPMIVSWHGLVPPRSEAALAAALPMTGVPAWRVFLGLPMTGGRQADAGLIDSATRGTRDYLLELMAPVVENAAGELPEALGELRRQLGVPAGPIGLAGFSVGATAALLTLAEGAVPVAAAALIAPLAIPTRVVGVLERRFDFAYSWSPESHGVATRLDFTSRAAEVADRGSPLLLISGESDEIAPPSDALAVSDALRARGARTVEAVTFRMGHALADEPGTMAAPPIAAAVSVDGALTDWFRRHLCQ
jgi:predicted esterase